MNWTHLYLGVTEYLILSAWSKQPSSNPPSNSNNPVSVRIKDMLDIQLNRSLFHRHERKYECESLYQKHDEPMLIFELVWSHDVWCTNEKKLHVRAVMAWQVEGFGSFSKHGYYGPDLKSSRLEWNGSRTRKRAVTVQNWLESLHYLDVTTGKIVCQRPRECDAHKLGFLSE